MSEKSVPSELYPQYCHFCLSLSIHIRAIGEGEVRVQNVGMMGAPILASSNTNADYAFICPSCEEVREVYDDEET